MSTLSAQPYPWRQLCSAAAFDPDHTLHSGQAFRWQCRSDDGRWIGVLSPSGAIVEIGREAGDVHASISAAGSVDDIASYFRLGEDFTETLADWRDGYGPEIAGAINRYAGLRVIRQDPVECLFSFMTSAAAPIFRIRRCMDGLCTRYGRKCGEVDGQSLHAFPTVEALAQVSRQELDELGFGFRGGNIQLAARQILVNGGDQWLRSLRSASYADAKRALMTLRGIGEKIADCVCLFSLDKDEAVPIDVHMGRIAVRLFGDKIGSPTSAAGYARISGAFVERFGNKAGWAQQYLYYAEIVGNGLWDDSLGRHRRPNEG